MLSKGSELQHPKAKHCRDLSALPRGRLGNVKAHSRAAQEGQTGRLTYPERLPRGMVGMCFNMGSVPPVVCAFLGQRRVDREDKLGDDEVMGSLTFGLLLLYLCTICVGRHRAGESSSPLLVSGSFNISEFPWMGPGEPEQSVTLDLDPAASDGIIPLTLTQQESGSLRMHCVLR